MEPEDATTRCTVEIGHCLVLLAQLGIRVLGISIGHEECLNGLLWCAGSSKRLVDLLLHQHTLHELPPTSRERAVRSRSRSGHVAVFNSPLGHFWSCRGLAWRSTHVTLKSQGPWSSVRQTCTSVPSSCWTDLRAWGCYALEWEDLRAVLPRALAALVPGTSAIPGQAEHDA